VSRPGGVVPLTMGTKEYLVCKVTEVLNQLTTLTGTDPEYDVYKADEAETAVLLSQPAALTPADDMMALCLIDTTADDGGMPPALIFEEGDYNLFLKFTAAPEVPRLGPFRFRVDD